ncbi:MAG: hypothetical protein Q4E73_10140 [Lachnospiraceae bacterium]|nr:hypothetical protein [Lachnospiraceae bacterium]
MKQKMWLVFFGCILIVAITGCQPVKSLLHNNKKEVSLNVRVGMDEKVSIPDPSTRGGEVSVSLMEEPAYEDFEKEYKSGDDEGEWPEGAEERYQNYLADLSFAGFDQPVFVGAHVVGNLTEASEHTAHITKKSKKGEDKKEVTGDCLGLWVATDIDTLDKYETKHDNNEWDNYYFVVLDYKNGVCYKTKTDFFFSALYDWGDLNAIDLTGNGVKELTVTNVYNKWIGFGAYRISKKEGSLKEIYVTGVGDDDDDVRTFFSGKLKDDYKVELEFPDIGYSKTVSMIEDGGYKKEDLEKEFDEFMDPNLVCFWKNGKLRRKSKKDDVFLYTLDHVDFVEKDKGMTQVELIKSVAVGHRGESIGNMHIYLEYDKDSDRLVLKDAEYVDIKTAEKEWDEWGDELYYE